MKTVLILGAGASVAQAIAQGIPDLDRPPTDRNFFQYCRNHNLEGITELTEFCQDSLGVNLVSPFVSMETVFNMIYSKAHQNDARSNRDRLMFTTLTKMLHRSIANSTHTIATDLNSPLTMLIKYLIEKNSLHDTSIISFNYDLLAEGALTHINKQYLFMNDSYKVGYFEILPPGPGDTGFFESTQPGGITYLKLHGSFNWFRGTVKREDEEISIPIDQTKLVIYSGHSIQNSFRLLKDVGETSHWADMLPAIVPPVYDKDDFYSRVFEKLWNVAATLLKESDAIIFYGYSLPNTDVKAHILFSSTTYKTVKKKVINLINTDPNVCAHFAKVLPIKSFGFHFGVHDYLIANDL